MARITAFINRKGGVGKSTLTVNTAATTAEVLGQSPADDPDYVVAISSDPQGSATWWSEQVGDELPFSFVQTKTRKDLGFFPELKKSKKIKHAFIDTPGWMDLPEDDLEQAGDPFGKSAAADAMRAVLSVADDIIVPIEPEPLGFMPTRDTIEQVVKPLGKPYWVVINNWDPETAKRTWTTPRHTSSAMGGTSPRPWSATTKSIRVRRSKDSLSPVTRRTASRWKPARTSTSWLWRSVLEGRAADEQADEFHHSAEPGPCYRRRQW